MNESLTIYVTAKDIREGEARSPDHCPVARAVRRAVLRTYPNIDPDTLTVQVMAAIAVQWGSDNGPRYINGRYLHASWPAKQWIDAFNSGLPVKPATFILT